MHSPPPRQLPQVSIHRDEACDNISITSSDPWTHRDQRQVLRERAHEDARTTIERRRDTRHQSDKRAGPAMDHPALGGSGSLPYEVGCLAFTRELRQFQWPSHRTFKPNVSEKYNGKTHPSEFLSIYTIAMQAAGARDDKICATSSLVPSLEATKLMARRVICISFPRRNVRTCASTYRGSAGCNTTSQMFILPP